MSKKNTVFAKEDKENFKNAFDAFDEDRDNLVETPEIGKLLRAVGFNPMPEEVEDMMKDIKSDKFDFKTFMYILYRHARECNPEQELVDAFKIFDKDGSGKIKLEKVREILKNLKQPFTDDQINELFGQAQKFIDKNNNIQYTEFVKVMLDF